MIYKEGQFVNLKDGIDIVNYGWYATHEEVKIVSGVSVAQLEGVKNMYIVESKEGQRVLVYEEEVEVLN